MMLANKTVIVYGGGGAVGGAVARACAAAGARLYLAGRSKGPLERVANEIGDVGACEVDVLDVLDEQAVASHAAAVAAEAGGIDVALNAVSFPFVHDTPFAAMTVEEIMHPIAAYVRTNLVTARAVAQHMTGRGSGTILTLSAGAARLASPGTLGFGIACAAIEAMSQRLAVELGPAGVRVVCLRPHMIADAPANGSYTAELLARRAAAAGLGVEQLLAAVPQNVTLLGRLPTLAQVADVAVFVASEHAAAMTGTVVDLTSGNAVRTATGALVGV